VPQIFHPSFNPWGKAVLFGLVVGLGGSAWVASELQRSSYVSDAGEFRDQPVPFSHEHHVRGLGLDCRYCHTSVERSSYAGMPPTKTCMTCHSQIWTNAQILQPVRDSWRDDTPIRWTRVHNLQDFVYFNHSIHIQKGIGCTSCHGQVDKMPLMMQTASLEMQWCLTCHREPERFLRPRDQVFSMDYVPPANQLELGRQLAKEYHLRTPQLMQNCSLCHR